MSDDVRPNGPPVPAPSAPAALLSAAWPLRAADPARRDWLPHHVRSGRLPSPSSGRAAVLQPASPATPASPPAHPRHVSPKLIQIGTNPRGLHAPYVEQP